jgi:BirA family transcriptional regulator, biotin operon repressor / biotin---[acetyl-CoA-carboxylase] ligase
LNELVPMLSRWEQEQFNAWRSEWLKLDAYAGKAVSIISGTSTVSGRACGVDSNGAIMIETPAGIQTFYGGEVSLRLTE